MSASFQTPSLPSKVRNIDSSQAPFDGKPVPVELNVEVNFQIF